MEIQDTGPDFARGDRSPGGATAAKELQRMPALDGADLASVQVDLLGAGLPQIRPDAARLCAAVFSRHFHVPDANGHGAHGATGAHGEDGADGPSGLGWSFRPALPPADEDIYRVDLSSERGRLSALLASKDPGWALSAAGEDEPPSRTTTLVRGLMLEPLLRELRRLGAQDWTLEDVRVCSRAEAQREQWLHAACKAQAFWFALLESSPALWSGLDAFRLGTGHHDDALRAFARPPARLRIGARPLHLRVLRSLEIGDVLLLGHAMGPNEPLDVAFRIATSGAQWLLARARVKDSELSFETGLQMTDDIDDPGPPAAPCGEDESSPSVVDDVELPVHFELETISISIGELEAIQPGYVIELEQPVREARVRLLVNGRLIGMAELVAVGDRLGARITELGFVHEPD